MNFRLLSSNRSEYFWVWVYLRCSHFPISPLAATLSSVDIISFTHRADVYKYVLIKLFFTHRKIEDSPHTRILLRFFCVLTYHFHLSLFSPLSFDDQAYEIYSWPFLASYAKDGVHVYVYVHVHVHIHIPHPHPFSLHLRLRLRLYTHLVTMSAWVRDVSWHSRACTVPWR